MGYSFFFSKEFGKLFQFLFLYLQLDLICRLLQIWLNLVQNGNILTIETGDIRPSGDLSVWVEPGAERLPAQVNAEDQHQITLPQGTQRVMLRFGQRWLPRWFDVESLP